MTPLGLCSKGVVVAYRAVDQGVILAFLEGFAPKRGYLKEIIAIYLSACWSTPLPLLSVVDKLVGASYCSGKVIEI